MFGSLTSKRFVVQLIFIFSLFTLGSAILLGIPAAILLERQTNTQLAALLGQTIQTTKALFDNQIIQIQDLASLLAQRPTLNKLVVEEAAHSELSQYLNDFLSQADLDAIMICRDNLPLITVGEDFDQSLCGTNKATSLFEDRGEAWLISKAPLDANVTGYPSVLVAQKVSVILGAFSEQTDMAYLLFAETDRLISTTLHDRSIPAEISKSSPDPSRKIKIGAASYIGDSIEINILEEYRLLGLLDIDPYLANTRQFRNLITLNLVGVSLVGAGVAVLVARRISNPLNQLAKSASALREGDLATPLTTPADVWEINQLSNALEDARVSLKHSLDQLRQEKLWIENLMNSMVECLLTIDDQGRITFVSRPIEKIMGIEPIFLLGKHLDEIFIITQGENLFSQQLPGENQTRRIPVIVDDSEILLSVSTSTVLPVESGNATRALMLRDVTDEERIHRLVGEFMANITHEFRTPLSALAASVELLRDALPDLSVEEMRQLLEALNLGIIDLQSLIDNLIEASSIEAGRFKVNPEKVELSTIIDHAINTVQPLLQKKGLQLQMPKSRPAFRVRADQRRTAQALINLLSNAIKHSPEGGRVSLRKLMMEGEVLIEIQDEGSGIQPEYQDRLFKRFVPHQSSQDLSTMGMGLGLSVVKAVIEAQGGKVGFRNHAGGGAIFWFTLETVPEDVS